MPQQPRQLSLLFSLSLFHIFIITISNYLVQIPFEYAGLHTTWGAFTFPFIFLATDLTVRIFGSWKARKIIFTSMFPALVVSYLVSVVFVDGVYQGSAGLSEFNTFVARIAFASFASYCIGQTMDITVFNKLRQNSVWWKAPACSTVFGTMIDGASFFIIAFAGTTDPYMSQHWVEAGLIDYAYKFSISMIFCLPLYGVLLRFLVDKLHVQIYMAPGQVDLRPV